MENAVSFTLPFGYEKDGKTHRTGTMHLATTGDELSIQDEDGTGMNTRYRDILLMTKVIDSIGDIQPVTVDVIRELYEPDFIYLQLLYRQLNGEAGTTLKTKCPFCGAVAEVQLAGLYDDMSIYQKEV
ncbi:MAG: phage tail assembly protein [Ruminococcus flavefaciens]|nr:phage tail assembly protein [Ruminococcus flavefaciens]